MLANQTKTTSMTAVSALQTSETQAEAIVYMNASINANGEVSFGKSIRNVSLYNENKEMCDRDYEEFEKSVLASV